MKNFVLIFTVLILTVMLANFDCTSHQPNSDEVQKQQQEKILSEGTRQTGMPAITHFQERKIMKMILEQRDREDLICYAYLQSEMTGKLIYIGRCMGYGLPYATQYTNPMKIEDFGSTSRYAFLSIPQADPNGLFTPSSAEGTWLMMLDDKDQPRVCYFEPKIVASPFKLNIGL